VLAVENDNDAATSGTLLLSVFFTESAEIVARRLVGNGGTSSTCSIEALVVVVVVAVVVGSVFLVSSIGDEVLLPDVVLFKRLPFPEGGLGSIGDADGGDLSCTDLQKSTGFKRNT